MNINEFDRLYRRTVIGVGIASGTVRLKLKPVKAKTLRVLTHVTVENRTSDGTWDRIGINAGGRDHYLDEIKDPLTEELIVSRSDLLLGEGDYFFAEFKDAGADAKLIMTCIGWEKGL